MPAHVPKTPDTTPAPNPAPPARPSIPLVARDGDRFGVHVQPLADGESRISIVAAVEGVTYAEVVHHLVKAVSALTRTPLVTVPTEAQMAEQAKRADTASKFPAAKLLVRRGERLCLSDAGMAAVGDILLGEGWIDAGPVPAALGVLPCDYMIDPDAFNAARLPPVPPEETNGKATSPG